MEEPVQYNSSRDQREEKDEDTVDEVDGLVVTVQTSENPQGTSTVGAIFLIINAALGAGLLNFPQQFHKQAE